MHVTSFSTALHIPSLYYIPLCAEPLRQQLKLTRITNSNGPSNLGGADGRDSATHRGTNLGSNAIPVLKNPVKPRNSCSDANLESSAGPTQPGCPNHNIKSYSCPASLLGGTRSSQLRLHPFTPSTPRTPCPSVPLQQLQEPSRRAIRCPGRLSTPNSAQSPHTPSDHCNLVSEWAPGVTHA